MSQLTTHKAEAALRSTARSTEPGWFWIVLIGGSIALHLVAVALILPLVGRSRSAAIDSTPVDFVELSDAPTSPAPIVSAPIAPALPAPAQAAPAASQATLPSGISAVPAWTQPVTQPAPASPIAPLPSAPPESQSPVPSSEPIAPSPIAPMPTAPAETPIATPAETPIAQASPAIPQSLPPSPTPQVSPSAPLVSTLPIDQAVPDVSQTLAVPSADPSQLRQVQTSREAQPIQLVASLQAADIPPAQLENPPPDTIAQPTEIANGVSSYIFVADPKVSSCIPDAAAASAIGSGTKVVVQVSTDAAGKVVEAALLQPSQNPSYDQLAVCLVQNWSFQPAIAAGQPVPSKALVVLVTIDRG
jgi:TonB family protein